MQAEAHLIFPEKVLRLLILTRSDMRVSNLFCGQIFHKRFNGFAVAVVAVFLFLPYGQRTANLQPAEGEDLLHAKILDPEESVVMFLLLPAMTLAVSKAT